MSDDYEKDYKDSLQISRRSMGVKLMRDDRFAPEGKIWICTACGKRSKDQYGIERSRTSFGWDESCMLNSVLVDDTPPPAIDDEVRG